MEQPMNKSSSETSPADNRDNADPAGQTAPTTPAPETAKQGKTDQPKSVRKGKTAPSTKHDQQPVFDPRHEQAALRHDPAAIRDLFLTGEFPYKNKLPTKEYEKKKAPPCSHRGKNPLPKI